MSKFVLAYQSWGEYEIEIRSFYHEEEIEDFLLEMVKDRGEEFLEDWKKCDINDHTKRAEILECSYAISEIKF